MPTGGVRDDDVRSAKNSGIVTGKVCSLHRRFRLQQTASRQRAAPPIPPGERSRASAAAAAEDDDDVHCRP